MDKKCWSQGSCVFIQIPWVFLFSRSYPQQDMPKKGRLEDPGTYEPLLTVWLFFTLTKWDDPSVAPPKIIYLSKPVFFFPSHLLKIIHRVRGHTLHLCGNRTIHRKKNGKQSRIQLKSFKKWSVLET